MLLDLFSTIVGGLIVVIGVCTVWVLNPKQKGNGCPFIFDASCICENLGNCEYIAKKEFSYDKRG